MTLQVKYCREVIVLNRVFPTEWDGGIIDILRGKSEMNPFFQFCSLTLIKLGLQKIFHRFDIMVGYFFGLFYFFSIFKRKIRNNGFEIGAYLRGQFKEFL